MQQRGFVMNERMVRLKKRKWWLSAEIVVRAVVATMLLPINAYYLVMEPSFIIASLLLAFTVQIGLPFSYFEKRIWKYQVVGLMVNGGLVFFALAMPG